MRTDHRRPLVAYVLVSVACAFVVAPSLNLGGLGLGERPRVGAFSDTTMTPSELAEGIYEPPVFTTLPEPADVVEPPVTDVGDSVVPGIGAINEVVGGPVVAVDGAAGEGTAAAGSDSPDSGSGGTQVVVASPLLSDLVDGGSPAGGDDGSTGSGEGVPAGNDPDSGPGISPGTGHGPGTSPDTSDGSGIFPASPPSDGEPGTGGSVAEDDAPTPGPENGPGAGSGNADGNGSGQAAPVPHSFDHVPPGAHPNGHVGPPPGSGPKDDGPKDKGENDKGEKDKEPQGNGPKDNGPKAKDPKANGPKDQDPKDQNPKDQDQDQKSKGKGKSGPH